MIMFDTRTIAFIFVLLVLAWSGYQPHDYFTWVLEVTPVLIALPVLIMTRKSFPLTPLSYFLIAVHATILMIGGHYTYAEVPLFNWLRDTFDLTRNHYDRLGHLAQGFVPAMIAREILLRKTSLQAGKMLFFLVTCVCLAISASYELIEWMVADMSGSDAVAFLATQGDVWDTQKDMLMALIGSVLAQWWLATNQDKQLRLLLPPLSR
jgi:putative membrane protein